MSVRSPVYAVDPGRQDSLTLYLQAMKWTKPLLNPKEVKQLYTKEKLSLREIGRQFGVSHQAVHFCLLNARVKTRSSGSTAGKPVKKQLLLKLYNRERLSVDEVAERLAVSSHRVKSSMKAHGIRTRPKGTHRRSSIFENLAVGSAIIIPRPEHKRYYPNFYGQAKNAGIRISIRTLNENSIELRRIE